ncbi:MAG: hypothetical protein KJ805_00540 [Alphaproteobacteria bacterium]|nr:hypothetical protein [Alphaproteobacteria bacterium]
MPVRKILLCMIGLSLTGCAHRPAPIPCPPPPPPPRDICTTGLVALYFKPDEVLFSRPFTGGFGHLTEVADKCEIQELIVTGLPDPQDPRAAGSLAARRATQVRDFFVAFDLPKPRFEWGDDEQREKPAVAYRSRRTQSLP